MMVRHTSFKMLLESSLETSTILETILETKNVAYDNKMHQ